jgi:hypothetical protein
VGPRRRRGVRGAAAGEVRRRPAEPLASFLPGDAESTKAEGLIQAIRGDQLPLVVVYRRDGGLTAARVREEAAEHGTDEGMLRGLAVTGGVITSAGIVLAGVFAVLGVLPLVFLTQIGFVVAFGVLLDTLIVRSLLVPALTFELGSRIWWPARWAAATAPAGSGPAPTG